MPAVGRAVLHALDLALDDLTKWTESLTDAEVQSKPLGLPSVAFHLRHIARSIDRILTYAEGGQLTGDQLAALKAEQNGEESLAMLLAEWKPRFPMPRIACVHLLPPTSTFSGRGAQTASHERRRALIHVADHTQRHVGQVVTTAKVLKALRSQ